MAKKTKKFNSARVKQYSDNTRRSMAFQGRDRPGSHNRHDTRKRFKRKDK